MKVYLGRNNKWSEKAMWFFIVIGLLVMALGAVFLWAAVISDEKNEKINKGLLVVSVACFVAGGAIFGGGLQVGHPDQDMLPEGTIFTVQSLDTNNTNYAYITVAPFSKENTTERTFYQLGYKSIENINGIKKGVSITNVYGTIKIVSASS